MDENSRVENLSTFAFYKIFNRGAGEKRRKNFLASHRKERIRLRLLLLSLLLLLSNRRTIKQKWRTRSILFSFYSTHLSSAREREKDGCTRTRRGMMAVERGKCPLPWKLHGGQWAVTRWHGAVACWNGRTQLGDVPTGKSDHTLRALRRKYMILPVA